MMFVSPYSYCFNVSPYYMHDFGIKAILFAKPSCIILYHLFLYEL